MKIAIIGSKAFDSLEYNLNDELLEQDYQSQIFDFESILPSKIDYGISLVSDKYVEYNNKKLLKRVLDFKPQLVIGVYRNIHPTFVKFIKKEGIKIIHINPDTITTFQSQQIFVEPYDAYFTKDHFIVDFMKNKLGLNVFHYLEAFNPRIHCAPNIEKLKFEENYNIDVIAFGNIYPYRARFLKNLEDTGLKVDVYGRKAKFSDSFKLKNFKNQYLIGKDKVNLLFGSKIVLNNFLYSEIQSVNNKFFEINGIGGFQLCDYTESLKDILPIDPKLVSFNSLDEAQELINYYLNNPQKRIEIQNKIYPHFLEHYTYKHLLNYVFNKI